MDPTTAIRTDTLPAVATLVIPGAVASGTYIYFGLLSLPETTTFLAQRDVLSTVLLVLLWIAAGFVVDSVGSYVEVHLIDAKRKDHEKLVKTWWEYLRTVWTNEPVGQRYLRRLLVSFKFELNMFTATFFAALGLLLLRFGYHITARAFYGLLVSSIVAMGVFWFFARDSADVLANVRKELTKGVIKK